MKIKPFTIFILIPLVWAGMAHGQVFELPPSMPLELHKPMDKETRAMQRRAAQLENRGEYQEALNIYRDLFDEFPEYDAFYNGVLRGFILTGEFEGGLAWVDSLKNDLEQRARPADLTASERERLARLIVDGGRLCGRMGRRDEALERWEALYALPNISASPYYRLFSAMLDIRHPDGLEDMARKARKATGNPSLLAASLANYWAQSGQVERAVEEWMLLMEVQPRQAENIKRAILALPEDEATQEQIIQSLNSALDKPAIRLHAIELLGSLYFRTRQWEKAYEQVKLADQLGGGSGLGMLIFAESLNTEAESDLSLKVLGDLAVSHPELSASPRGLLARARALEIAKNYLPADSVYSLITRSRNLRTSQGQEALLLQAQLRLRYLNQPEAARELLKDGLERLPRMRNRGAAALLIGDTYFMQRNLPEARQTYLEVAEGRFGPDKKLLSQALVNAAKVDFYVGEFDEAANRLKEASQRSPDDRLTNDALDMLNLLRAGKDDSTTLKTFAAAELEQKLGNEAEAETLYTRVVRETKIGDLAERALLKIADLQRTSGRSEEAIESLTRSLDRYPNSLRAPEILLRIGEILEQDLADPKSAMEVYERILIDYPESLQVEEARKRIRRLEIPET